MYAFTHSISAILKSYASEEKIGVMDIKLQHKQQYFVLLTGNTYEEAVEVVDELIEHRWLDEYTRAIFIEFLTYNPNLNLFGISLSVAEFTETGGGQCVSYPSYS